MFRAIDVDAVKNYVSPNDPDPAKPTVFMLGIIDPHLRSHIDSQCFTSEYAKDKNSSAKVNVDVTKHSILMVKFGLRGIKGLFDKDGTTEIELKLDKVSINRKAYDVVPDSMINMLGTSLVMELAEEIEKNQGLSEDETKN